MTTLELIEKHGIGHNCLSDAYELGRADQKEEMIPLLKAIKFVLDDYATRLADYSKVIDEQLKEKKE